MTLDEYLITNKEATYMLKVDGESMIEAGILPGDLLEDVSEVLVCYSLWVYESPSTLQPNRVTS